MKLDAYIISTIKDNLKISGLTKSAFAEKLGKANSWVSKLFSGELQSLDDETAMRIQEILDFEFFETNEYNSYHSKIKILADDKDFRKIILSLIKIRENKVCSKTKEFEKFYMDRKKKFLRLSEDADFALKAAEMIRKTCSEIEDRYLAIFIINRMEKLMDLPFSKRANIKTPPQRTNESS